MKFLWWEVIYFHLLKFSLIRQIFTFFQISRARQCETRVKLVCLEIGKDLSWAVWRKLATIHRWISIFSFQTENFLSYWGFIDFFKRCHFPGLLKALLNMYGLNWKGNNFAEWCEMGLLQNPDVLFLAQITKYEICANAGCGCHSMSFPVQARALRSCPSTVTVEQGLVCTGDPSFIPELFLPISPVFNAFPSNFWNISWTVLTLDRATLVGVNNRH